MPNWMTNRITVTGVKTELEQFLQAIGDIKSIDNPYDGKTHVIDFDRIIPEPQTIDQCDPECITQNASKDHITEDKNRPWFNWYEWHNKYWGVKWNACGHDLLIEKQPDDDIYTISIWFDTPWGSPVPVIKKLIAMTKDYPNLEYELMFAEEQGAVDTGVMEFSKGTITRCQIPEPGSKEACEIATEIIGYTGYEDDEDGESGEYSEGSDHSA